MNPIFADTGLCVVGNINRDVKLAPIDPGEHLFEDGESPTDAIRETIGGGGANSALAAASLGAAVSFIGKTGADALGDRLARTLAARGVDARLVRDATHPTGTSVNLVWTNGRRHFVSCLPHAKSLRFDEIDLASLQGNRHLLRADPWFSEPMLLDGGNRALFEAAKRLGLAVSLDINFDPFGGSPQRRGALRDVLPWVDLVHGNVGELCQFTETNSLDNALQTLERFGAGAVVVHMGERGAGFYRAGELVIEPAAPLTGSIVNTTGTGDVLSVCMMLLHERNDLAPRDKLHASNAIVAEYMTGMLDLVPEIID